MKFKQAFFSSACEIFSTPDECRDIFYEFFGPSIARVEKFVKMLRDSSSVKKNSQKNQKKHKKKSLLNFHWSKPIFKTDVHR